MVDTAGSIVYSEGMETNELHTFQVGQSYECRSACDYDTVWTLKVLRRTAKFVTLQDVSHGEGETMRVGVRTFDFGGVNRETCSPFGTYSMAPVLSADRPTVAR